MKFRADSDSEIDSPPRPNPGILFCLICLSTSQNRQKSILKKNKIPGLGRGGLSISESESARNFMDKCVYENFPPFFFFFFREQNTFLISRMDLASGGSRNSLFYVFNQKQPNSDQILQKVPK